MIFITMAAGDVQNNDNGNTFPLINIAMCCDKHGWSNLQHCRLAAL